MDKDQIFSSLVIGFINPQGSQVGKYIPSTSRSISSPIILHSSKPLQALLMSKQVYLTGRVTQSFLVKQWMEFYLETTFKSSKEYHDALRKAEWEEKVKKRKLGLSLVSKVKREKKKRLYISGVLEINLLKKKKDDGLVSSFILAVLISLTKKRRVKHTPYQMEHDKAKLGIKNPPVQDLESKDWVRET